MNDQFLKVNIDSIKSVRSEYDLHSKNILNDLSDILNMFNDMDDIFYTKTAIEYKNRVTKYINKTIDTIENELIYFNDQFDGITNLYTELYNDIKSNVSNKSDMEV